MQTGSSPAVPGHASTSSTGDRPGGTRASASTRSAGWPHSTGSRSPGSGRMRSVAPRPEAFTERTILDLVRGLCGIPAASFTRATVLLEIGRTVLDPGSLESYLFFRRSHYTRNLIHRDDLFEVVAIGWEPGQASAIHNHRG